MTDAMNAKMRVKDRHPLFTVYPELMVRSNLLAIIIISCLIYTYVIYIMFSLLQESSNANDDSKPPPPIPEEKFGLRFLVKCHHLNFELKAERNGNTDHVRYGNISFVI